MWLFLPHLIFSATDSISFFNFHSTLCTDFSRIQPDFPAEQQQHWHLWLDALHTPISMSHSPPSQLLDMPPMQWLTHRIGNYRYIYTHTYIHTHILSKLDFFLSLLLFQFMTHADMFSWLKWLPFSMFCLSHELAPQLHWECFLMTMLHFKYVQVSSGANSFSHSNVYADLAWLTQSLYCSVRELLLTLCKCKTLWALGCYVFLVQSCSL